MRDHFPKINPRNQGLLGTTYKYLIYGNSVTPGTTYKYQSYGNFPKINISYQGTGTLGTTYKCLIYCHFHKISISYLDTPETNYDYLSESKAQVGVQGDGKSCGFLPMISNIA